MPKANRRYDIRMELDECIALAKLKSSRMPQRWRLREAETYKAVEGALGLSLPDFWKGLLPFLSEEIGSRGTNTECSIWGPDRLEAMHRAYNAGVLAGDEPKKSGWLHFGRNDFGDWYSFEADSPMMPRDCPVVMWNHENGSISMRWQNVGEFIAFELGQPESDLYDD